MAAFQWAVDRGARWLETDVRLTADGHLVCHHDETLERTTSSTGPIARRRLEEVEALGLTSLADAVDRFPHARWNIDLKQHRPSMVPAVVRFLADGDLHHRVRVASFSGAVIRAFRRVTGGRVRTAAAADEVARAYAMARAGRSMRRPSYDALQVPVWVADPRMAWAAHRAGVELHAWTVDDPALARRLVERGIDGVITNRMDLLAPLFS